MSEVNPTLQKFIEWLKLTDEEKIKQGLPLTQREFSRIYEVSEPQLSEWKRELSLVRVKPSEIEALKEQILKVAQKGENAQMARLAWDITHPKEEKAEAEFTAEDYANFGNELKERLEEELASIGVCPVCHKPKISSNELCLDTKPRNNED